MTNDQNQQTNEQTSPTSAEIKAAMLQKTPVIYDNTEYERISAYIYRIGQDRTGRWLAYMQVELVDKSGGGVVVVEPRNITIKKQKEISA